MARPILRIFVQLIFVFCLYFRYSETTVVLKGSNSFPESNRSYTLTCIIKDPSHPQGAHLLRNSSFIGSVQLGVMNNCYDTSRGIPKVCLPDQCDCEVDGSIFRALWTFVISPKTVGEYQCGTLNDVSTMLDLQIKHFRWSPTGNAYDCPSLKPYCITPNFTDGEGCFTDCKEL